MTEGNVYTPGTRLRCLVDHMGVEPGVMGTLQRGADYWPGLDAGQFTIAPDTFPASSPYGHNAVSYWTADEVLGYWEVVGWQAVDPNVEALAKNAREAIVSRTNRTADRRAAAKRLAEMFGFKVEEV